MECSDILGLFCQILKGIIIIVVVIIKKKTLYLSTHISVLAWMSNAAQEVSRRSDVQIFGELQVQSISH